MDNLSKQQRSYCMSRIRSKWTNQEKRAHNFLRTKKIKHIMHPKIEGKPDILIQKSNTVVYLNGCFWHKCPKCFKKPKTNISYWTPKIKGNVIRDKKNKKLLKSKGYKVVILWEHELKSNFDRAVKKLNI